jgi:hypothetical protein
MPLPKRKRKGPIIVSGIPFDGRESVNFVTVSKHKRRVTTVSTEISVPIVPSSHAEEPARSLPPLWAAEYDTSVYSDTEEAAAVPTAQKTERKGPSRSVSVSSFSFLHAHFPVGSFQPQTKVDEWFEIGDKFMDDMMKDESPGRDSDRRCTTCSAPNALFRCLDCLFPSMTCQSCLIAAHQSEVLHTIEVSPLVNGICSVHNLDYRDGPGNSSSPNLFPTLVLYTNLATPLRNAANYPRSQPHLLSLTSLGSTPSVSPTASVIPPVPPISVAHSSCMRGGFPRRGRSRAQCSPSGCSISFTNSKRKARSTCMICMLPLSPSRTPQAWNPPWYVNLEPL